MNVNLMTAYSQHCTVSVVDEWTGMERGWNYSDVGKTRYLENNPYLWHFIQDTSHLERPGIEPSPCPKCNAAN